MHSIGKIKRVICNPKGTARGGTIFSRIREINHMISRCKLLAFDDSHKSGHIVYLVQGDRFLRVRS